MALEYHFEPGRECDGVTVVMPVVALASLRPEPFEWLVPGYLPEKVQALLRTLPKSERRDLLPLADAARDFLARDEPAGLSLEASLRDFAARRLGRPLPASPFDVDRLPGHLRARFRVLADDGSVLAEGRDLARLQAEHAEHSREHIAELARESEWHRQGVREWDFGELPESWQSSAGGIAVNAHPAIVARPGGVDLDLLETLEAAERVSRLGVARLLLLALPEQSKVLAKAIPERLALRYSVLAACPLPACSPAASNDLLDEVSLAATRSLVTALPRSPEAFEEITEASRGLLWRQVSELAELADKVTEQAASISARLAGVTSIESRRDMQEQLSHLVFRGCLLYTPDAWRRRLRAWLRGLELRIEKAAHDPDRDQRRLEEVRARWQAWQQATLDLKPVAAERPEWLDYRFRLEELRLSIFAQEVKTAGPVSPKRLDKAWARLGVTPPAH
jgi:ATP-dependent helicase HrpA